MVTAMADASPKRPDSRTYFTMTQVARKFGIAVSTLQSWYDNGDVDGFRTGNQHLKDTYGRVGTSGARRIYVDAKFTKRVQQYREFMVAHGREGTLKR
jgi:hypothetical protein